MIAVDASRAPRLRRRPRGARGVLTGPEAADGILAANGGRKVDVVFDFVGAQESLDLAAAVTGRGGAIVVTGGGGGPAVDHRADGRRRSARPRDRDHTHVRRHPRRSRCRRSRSPGRPGPDAGRATTSLPPAWRWPSSSGQRPRSRRARAVTWASLHRSPAAPRRGDAMGKGSIRGPNERDQAPLRANQKPP